MQSIQINYKYILISPVYIFWIKCLRKIFSIVILKRAKKNSQSYISQIWFTGFIVNII